MELLGELRNDVCLDEAEVDDDILLLLLLIVVPDGDCNIVPGVVGERTVLKPSGNKTYSIRLNEIYQTAQTKSAVACI